MGTYYAKSQRFDSNVSIDTRDYVAKMNTAISNKRKMSSLILTRDYYAHVLPN